MATLSEPEPSLAVSWTPGREGALRPPPRTRRPAPPGLCLGGRPGGRWPARCEREPHVQQVLPSTASSSSARPRRSFCSTGCRGAPGDAGRGGPPAPPPHSCAPWSTQTPPATLTPSEPGPWVPCGPHIGVWSASPRRFRWAGDPAEPPLPRPPAGRERKPPSPCPRGPRAGAANQHAGFLCRQGFGVRTGLLRPPRR